MVRCDRIIVITTEMTGNEDISFPVCCLHESREHFLRIPLACRFRHPNLYISFSVHGFEINLCIMIASMYVNLYC